MDWLTQVALRQAADVVYSGFFGHGEMQKEFEEAAFRLEPGQMSGIVQTASGLHLIQRYGDPSVHRSSFWN